MWTFLEIRKPRGHVTLDLERRSPPLIIITGILAYKLMITAILSAVECADQFEALPPTIPSNPPAI